MVLDIIPGVEAVVDPNLLILSSVLFGEVEELFEVLDELFEEEITVNLSLNCCWELIEKLLVLISAYRLVLVVDPSVVKVLFDLKF